MFKKGFWKDKKTRKITASLFLLAVFLLLSLFRSGNQMTFEVDETPEDGTVEDIKLEEVDIIQDKPGIFVDVIGCVANPGVYQLPAESRVFQAIELAGGLTEDAEVRSINRAAILSDEQVITVLSVEEYARNVKGEGGIGFVDGKVELNSANSQALESLSGIGPAMAQRIMQYREENGGFDSVEELKNIDGIGEKTFQRLKDSVCVQ